MRILVFAACVAAMCACSFDESGIAGGDGAVADAQSADARVTDGPSADAAPCSADLVATISVDGVSTGSPLQRVLVGDTVTLSAAGSCSQTPGGLTYEWQISPIDATRVTAEPSLFAETLTVYPVSVEQYTVSLTIRDSIGRVATVQVFGFETHGWERIDGIPSNQVRGLAVGPQDLFIAGPGGAFRLPLDAPTDGFVTVNNESVGETISSDLQTVHWDAAQDVVWFGASYSRTDLWKVTRTAPFVVSRIDYGDVLDGSSTVRDINALTSGIEIATDEGVAETTNGTTFLKTFDGSMYAVARGVGQRWAASNKLYDLDDGGTEFDPLSTPDNRIRRLLVDTVNDELWLATDNNGVAQVANSTGAVIELYTTNTSNLPDNRVRDIAIETSGRFAGDIWIATQNGVGRFKRDRGVWVHMGTPHGLSSRNDLHAIAIDENSGRRRIYAGSTGGLVYSRAE